MQGILLASFHLSIFDPKADHKYASKDERHRMSLEDFSKKTHEEGRWKRWLQSSWRHPRNQKDQRALTKDLEEKKTESFLHFVARKADHGRCRLQQICQLFSSTQHAHEHGLELPIQHRNGTIILERAYDRNRNKMC